MFDWMFSFFVRLSTISLSESCGGGGFFLSALLSGRPVRRKEEGQTREGRNKEINRKQRKPEEFET
jgi:hypothetical protein